MLDLLSSLYLYPSTETWVGGELGKFITGDTTEFGIRAAAWKNVLIIIIMFGDVSLTP